ncbi:hypothetical protein FGO68_gene1608 [Halteria grandinella]|uniref:Uncharacterized protein n=1 Tax=Halteria grandinella TaxID=5974 RepID=A0A8J8P6H8_HALGN|nr:hypothetical protein FGO68_gene1608 [Halteria grandinella]
MSINQIALLLLFRLTFQVCPVSQAPFPKLIGGTLEATYINQVDYQNGYLAAVGCSKDQALRGDTFGSGMFIPIVLVYSGPDFSYLWGKAFSSMTGDPFEGLKIDSMGTKVVLANYMTNRYLIILDLATGNRISATFLFAANTFDHQVWNLLLLNSGMLYMGDGTQIFKIDPVIPAANKYSAPSYQTVGLQYNSDQTRLHIFSFATNVCILTVVDITTFAPVFSRQVQCQSATFQAVAQTFQSCVYQESAQIETTIFQEGTIFFRMRSQYLSSTFTGTTMHDPTSPSLQSRALHCGSTDLIFSLMWGSYQTETNRIYVATVDFNSGKIIYTRFLQQLVDVRPGVIINGNTFYVPSATQTINKSPSVPFTLGSFDHAIIYSPVSTCQQLDEYEYPSVTLTPNQYTFSASPIAFTSGTHTVTDKTDTHPSPNKIDQDQIYLLRIGGYQHSLTRLKSV